MFGKHHTKKSKLKISLTKLGKKDTLETKSKKSLARLGSNNPNYGKHWSEEIKSKISLANIGRKLSQETKNKMRLNHPRNTGVNSPNWKGGIYPKYLLLRTSYRARQWRKLVYERDNYTCQTCNKRGCFLNAHHIKPFKFYPKLRFIVSNGTTLCVECHRDIHKKEQQLKYNLEACNV